MNFWGNPNLPYLSTNSDYRLDYKWQHTEQLRAFISWKNRQVMQPDINTGMHTCSYDIHAVNTVHKRVVSIDVCNDMHYYLYDNIHHRIFGFIQSSRELHCLFYTHDFQKRNGNGRCEHVRLHMVAWATPGSKTDIFMFGFHLLQWQRRGLPEIAWKLRLQQPPLIEVGSIHQFFLREVSGNRHWCVGSILECPGCLHLRRCFGQHSGSAGRLW